MFLYLRRYNQNKTYKEILGVTLYLEKAFFIIRNPRMKQTTTTKIKLKSIPFIKVELLWCHISEMFSSNFNRELFSFYQSGIALFGFLLIPS